jgi:Na+/proline symporter
LSIIISFYFLYESTGGLTKVISQIRISSPETLAIFPPQGNKTFWYSIAVYLGIQWWSASMFDGGGPEMSRYTAAETRWGAIKAGLTPIIINIFIMVLLVAMSLMSFANNNSQGNGELAIIESIFSVIPKGLSMIVLIGFFALFITTAESVLNWGASFLVVDFYKGYLVKNKKSEHYSHFSFIVMLFLSLVSVLIAVNINSLELLIKIFFSISAGVAPVFILRWFWMRVNSWSQISAMLSSCIYTFLFFIFQDYYPHFFDNSNLHAYEWRMIFVTFLTTVTWLLVTFITPKDSKKITDRFLKILPSKTEILKSFGIAFAIGISLILFLVLLLKLII